MSGTVKGLIAGIAAIVVLGGGIAALKLTEPKPDTGVPDSSVSYSDNLTIYNGNANDIKSISVKNTNGGYKLIRTAEVTETKMPEYKIEGLENVKLNDTIVGSLPANVATLEALKVIEEDASDMSKYGLDKSDIEATIEFDGENAKTVTLVVGNDTAEGNVYVALKGEKTVYTVSSSSVSSYVYEKEYFVSLVCVEEPPEDDYPIVQSVTVDQKALEYDIVFEYDPDSDSDDELGGTTASHVMTSPVDAYLNISDSVNYTHGIFGLRASTVLSISPTEEELKVAGIDNPVCTVTTTLDDGSSYVLKIGIEYGEEGNTGYIGYLEGTDILWLFDKGSLPWVGMVPEDAMASLIFGTYIYDLSSLTLITDAGTRSFVFDGNSADDYLVLLDGREYDLERYRNFYQALISAPAEQIYLDDLGATKKIATVILEKNDGSESETVEFFDAGNREVIISKNGKVSFKSRASYIEKAFLPNIERLDTDEEFVTNW